MHRLQVEKGGEEVIQLHEAEIQVIEELCAGKAIKEIAYDLNKTARTVEDQIYKAKKRNGCRSTIHLCILWSKQNYKAEPAKQSYMPTTVWRTQ
jgi:DNA-binding NarL/FixJ family response regulator